jgi:hypothetical protein
LAIPTPGNADVVPIAPAAPVHREYSVLDAIGESILGDVYDPSKWRELSLGTFFTDGWNEPWASPPNGDGGHGAPRQGWLNAYDGVFYRLFVTTFGFARELNENGNGFTSGVTLYTPFNRRFELQYDIPFITSSRGGPPGRDYHISGGDLQITPRFILSETQDVTQSFNVTFRAPTGDTENGNGVAAVTPTYQVWANCWRGLVVRGGAGMSVPFNHQGVREVGARTTVIGDLAAGYYFTPHDLTPIGDLVGYLAANLTQATDDRGPATTTLTLTPGFRSHVGRNWYLLGGIEVPVTTPQPFDYQVLAGLMKVF